MWQITPSELPDDMHPFALELWRDESGGLHLFHLHVGGDRSGDWWNRVVHVDHFVEAPRGGSK